MRLVKMLGLAAVAALAAMAFVGASSASATMTALCNAKPELKVEGGTNSLHCPAGKKFVETVLVLGKTVEEPKLLEPTNGNDIKCKEATFDATLNTEEGTNKDLVLGESKVVFVGPCSVTGLPCSVVSVTANAAYATHVEYLGDVEPAGLLVLLKPATTVLLKCFLVGHVTCVYGANENVHGSLFNEGNMHLTIKAPVKTTSGGLCPKEGIEDALSTLTVDGKLSPTGSELKDQLAWVALL